MDLDYTGEITYQLPDKFNMTITASVGGEKVVIEQIANGKQVKQNINGKAVEMMPPRNPKSTSLRCFRKSNN